MSYPSVLSDLISGKEDIFRLAVEGRSRKFVIYNLLIIGILFGLSNFIGAISTAPDLPLEGKFALITPLIFCLAGFFSMAGALIGMTLVYWAAAKAFGGHGSLIVVFDLLGLAIVPFWIIAPLLNYSINFASSKILFFSLWLVIGIAASWSFKLFKSSLIVGMGLSRRKADIAIGCMWIFSVSSIYVFLP